MIKAYGQYNIYCRECGKKICSVVIENEDCGDGMHFYCSDECLNKARNDKKFDFVFEEEM